MAELQNISLGYIADAGLAYDAANTLLSSERPFDEHAARKMLEELSRQLTIWSRGVGK